MKWDWLVDEIWADVFYFFFLLSSLCFSFPDLLFFFYLNVTDLSPKHMGPTLSHTRKPNKCLSLDYVMGSTKLTCFLQNCSFSVGIGFVIISYIHSHQYGFFQGKTISSLVHHESNDISHQYA